MTATHHIGAQRPRGAHRAPRQLPAPPSLDRLATLTIALLIVVAFLVPLVDGHTITACVWQGALTIARTVGAIVVGARNLL